jgi:hypothetical protein
VVFDPGDEVPKTHDDAASSCWLAGSNQRTWAIKARIPSSATRLAVGSTMSGQHGLNSRIWLSPYEEVAVCRYLPIARWTERIALEPSPTAAAIRFIEP